MATIDRSSGTAAFGADVASFYEELMVPMIFEPFADDLVKRLSTSRLGDVLELAAGTGIVTRKLGSLSADIAQSILATDISQAMLDKAQQIYPDARIAWKAADAMALALKDSSFDTVICQFGAMFFKDRPMAYGEAKRVLRSGGRFVFNVWDRLEANDFVNTVQTAIAKLFPKDPPSFLGRVPHGYFDRNAILDDLKLAGFAGPFSIDAVEKRSEAQSVSIPARAFTQGTPLRDEILTRTPDGLEAATQVVEQAFLRKFGEGPISGHLRAFLVTVHV
jgi:SAM-dependent methyltransferase